MTRRTSVVPALAVGTGALVLIRELQRRQAGKEREAAEPRSRWRAVTINRSTSDIMPEGRLPAPLAELGNLVEVEVRPAPGGKGSELRARFRNPEPTGAASVAAKLSGDDPRQRVRAALREAKQLIEVGEVLRVDPASHGHRPPTPTGKLVDLATDRAPGEGVL
ncbi:hypothetical protein [Arthrobacter agilis]|uniref:hypothetical protein n=1 Tax=Arthrobacter agilis TaxID=37921 RepID=UPI002782B1CE|nr:hypothetical protein [Arthrobacter agilis]MDQ0734805.1 hypothetical protein [Arthrobacter agilis]